MKRTVCVLAILLLIPVYAFAAFDYGDLEGDTLWFTDVGETEGFFGAPEVIGDSILFKPQDFAVEAMNGLIDHKNGHMWMTLTAKDGRDIDSIEIEENGDFSLLGIGSENTYVTIAGKAFIYVTHIEGVALANSEQFEADVLYKKTNDTYRESGKFDLVTDGGTEFWEGELKFDVDALLQGRGIVGKATSIYFTMNNILFATTETGTLAQIEKKGINAFTVTVPVPEPATILMLGLGGLLLIKRR